MYVIQLLVLFISGIFFMNKKSGIFFIGRQWCVDFLNTLFDFSFQRTITNQMLPVLFGIGIITLLTSISYFAVVTFMDNWLKGLLFITFLAPAALLFGIALIRIFLEFFAAVFTMLNALRSTLASISRLENTFMKVQTDISLMRRRMTEMTLTLESMDMRLARMDDVLMEIDQIATRIPFLKTKKSTKKDDDLKDELQDEDIIEAILRESPTLTRKEARAQHAESIK